MSDIAIHVEGLSKRYQLGHREPYLALRDVLTNMFRAPFSHRSTTEAEDFWALKDVSFDVRQGEVIGVIGRNGAGKSTLLKILSRITQPTEGYIRIRGRVGSLLEVGTGFHPELTGRENIFLNGAILGMKRHEIMRKFDEIVAFAEIEQFIDTPVKRYSSGMYMRLAFAVAAHLEPEILLVDEVLAVGDAAFQKKCLGKMGEVAKEGRTVLFVSHQMAAVQSLCSHAVMFGAGKICHRGSTIDVIQHYLQDFDSRHNRLLRDRIDRSGDGRLRVVGVHFEDAQGKPIETPMSGQDVVIVLEYESSTPLGYVSMSLGFYGLQGQFLLMCGNELSGYPLSGLPPCGKICCTLPRLPFASGTYSVNIYAEISGVMADWVQEAFQIDVVAGDFYGTGRIPQKTHGGFLALQIWNTIT